MLDQLGTPPTLVVAARQFMSTIGGQGWEEVTTNAKEARNPLPLMPTAVIS
jgi:hypothetical protein